MRVIQRPPAGHGSLAIVMPFLDGRHLLGIEREAIELANELNRRGRVIEIVTSTRGWRGGRATDPAELDPGIAVTRIQGYIATGLAGLQPSRAPLIMPRLRRHVLRHDACIVFNAGWPCTLALSGILRSRIPVLYRTYWHPPRGRLDRLNNLRVAAARTAFRHTTLLLAPTREEAELLVERGLAQEAQVRVVGPGVSQPCSGPADRAEIRQRIGVPESALLVTQIGSPSLFKGTPTLVDAATRVRSTGVDMHLALIGRVFQEESIAVMIEEPWIHRVGPLSDDEKSGVLAASDALAMLSEYEAFGFVALEALAHGVCPAIYDDFPSSGQLQSWGAITIPRSEGIDAVADGLLRASSTRISGSFRSWAAYADDVSAALSGSLPPLDGTR